MVQVLLDICKFGTQKTIGGREIMNDIERRLNNMAYIIILNSLFAHTTHMV